MGGIGGIGAFVELTPIPRADEYLDGVAQRLQTTRETTRAAGEPCKVVTQFSITAFDRIGLALVRQGLVLPGIVDQLRVDAERIAVVLLRLWTLIEHGLKSRFRAVFQNTPIDDAARGAINLSHDIHFVFFEPTNVNNSSSS